MKRPGRQTPLAEKITRMIAQTGPLSVSEYFNLCLSEPEHGYYQTREPFGRSGDFITAPEVTQLFGEMLAIFAIHGWQQMGEPQQVSLVELGPGRGTLMRDMLRVIEQLVPRLAEALSVHMVETSPRLIELQRTALSGSPSRPAWHNSLSEVPEGATLLFANEFFDALPVRQFVKTVDGFRERVVGLGTDGALTFGVGTASIDQARLPPGHEKAPEGTIFEIAPAREAIASMIGARLKAHDGIALVIDYGHIAPGFGDTLQALYRQTFDPPLSHPGLADLTSHVDFSALAGAAASSGAHVAGFARQGEFLLALGLLERAGLLGAGKDTLTQTAIRDAVERVAGEGKGAMGELFKVLCLSSRPLKLTPFASKAAL